MKDISEILIIFKKKALISIGENQYNKMSKTCLKRIVKMLKMNAKYNNINKSFWKRFKNPVHIRNKPKIQAVYQHR